MSMSIHEQSTQLTNISKDLIEAAKGFERVCGAFFEVLSHKLDGLEAKALQQTVGSYADHASSIARIQAG